MAIDQRAGRLVPAAADEKYPEKTAEINVRTSTVKSFFIVIFLIISFIGIIVGILALGI